MTRILHVAQPTVGGVPLYVMRIARRQLEAGADVELAGAGPFSAATESGIRLRQWSARTAPGPGTPREVLSLNRVIDAADPDVVHLHSSKAGLAGRLVLRGRRPTVFQPHAWSFYALTGSLRRAAVGWEQVAARWTHRVVCVSEGERDEGLRHRINANYAVVPNGVDLARWWVGPDDRERARRDLAVDDGPVAITIGRVVPQKGHDILIRIWPRVREAVPGARLYVVGDGPQRPALEGGAPEGITFVGETAEVERWMAATNLVVLPSRYEGMSLAMLEAMAAARSVVISDVAGAREAVQDDAGAVVAVGNDAGFVRALAERLSQPDQADAEGAAGRARAAARYSLDNVVAGLDHVYADLLARPQPQ